MLVSYQCKDDLERERNMANENRNNPLSNTGHSNSTNNNFGGGSFDQNGFSSNKFGGPQDVYPDISASRYDRYNHVLDSSKVSKNNIADTDTSSFSSQESGPQMPESELLARRKMQKGKTFESKDYSSSTKVSTFESSDTPTLEERGNTLTKATSGSSHTGNTAADSLSVDAGPTGPQAINKYSAVAGGSAVPKVATSKFSAVLNNEGMNGPGNAPGSSIYGQKYNATKEIAASKAGHGKHLYESGDSASAIRRKQPGQTNRARFRDSFVEQKAKNAGPDINEQLKTVEDSLSTKGIEVKNLSSVRMETAIREGRLGSRELTFSETNLLKKYKELKGQLPTSKTGKSNTPYDELTTEGSTHRRFRVANASETGSIQNGKLVVKGGGSAAGTVAIGGSYADGHNLGQSKVSVKGLKTKDLKYAEDRTNTLRKAQVKDSYTSANAKHATNDAGGRLGRNIRSFFSREKIGTNSNGLSRLPIAGLFKKLQISKAASTAKAAKAATSASSGILGSFGHFTNGSGGMIVALLGGAGILLISNFITLLSPILGVNESGVANVKEGHVDELGERLSPMQSAINETYQGYEQIYEKNMWAYFESAHNSQEMGIFPTWTLKDPGNPFGLERDGNGVIRNSNGTVNEDYTAATAVMTELADIAPESKNELDIAGYDMWKYYGPERYEYNADIELVPAEGYYAGFGYEAETVWVETVPAVIGHVKLYGTAGLKGYISEEECVFGETPIIGVEDGKWRQIDEYNWELEAVIPRYKDIDENGLNVEIGVYANRDPIDSDYEFHYLYCGTPYSAYNTPDDYIEPEIAPEYTTYTYGLYCEEEDANIHYMDMENKFSLAKSGEIVPYESKDMYKAFDALTNGIVGEQAENKEFLTEIMKKLYRYEARTAKFDLVTYGIPESFEPEYTYIDHESDRHIEASPCTMAAEGGHLYDDDSWLRFCYVNPLTGEQITGEFNDDIGKSCDNYKAEGRYTIIYPYSGLMDIVYLSEHQEDEDENLSDEWLRNTAKATGSKGGYSMPKDYLENSLTYKFSEILSIFGLATRADAARNDRHMTWKGWWVSSRDDQSKSELLAEGIEDPSFYFLHETDPLRMAVAYYESADFDLEFLYEVYYPDTTRTTYPEMEWAGLEDGSSFHSLSEFVPGFALTPGSGISVADASLETFLSNFYYNQGDIQAVSEQKGLCCFSTYMMIASYYNGIHLSTNDLAAYAQRWCLSDGTFHGQSYCMNQFGFRATKYTGSQYGRTISEEIAAGHPVILYLHKNNKGLWKSKTTDYTYHRATGHGHFMVITSIDCNGNVTVADPGKRANNTKIIPWEDVISLFNEQAGAEIRTTRPV